MNSAAKTPGYSFTMLSTAYECRRKYKHVFIDKTPVEAQSSADLAFGTAIHLGLESLLTGSSDYMQTFERFWEIEAKRDLAYGRCDHEDLLRQARILLPRFERLHSKKFKLHQMEQRLYGELGGVPMEGTPDFLGDYNGIPSVVDFKTSGYRYPKEKVVIGDQMYLYSHLAKLTGYEVKQHVYVVLIKGKDPSIQVITHTPTPEQIDRALTNLTLQASAIKRIGVHDSYTQNRNHCLRGEQRCPYLINCFPELKSNKKEEVAA